MASFQAHMVDVMCRVQIKRRMRKAKDVFQVRASMEGASLPPPAGVTITPATVGGVTGEWVVRAGADRAGPTLLYLHGGGYVACSPRTHRPITGAYAREGLAVFVPDYRLAPEHPFPAALDDALAAWNGLVAEGHSPASIGVSGDSAGGGLSLALLLKLRDLGQPLPGAAMLFSPWTDLAGTGETIVSNAGSEALLWAPSVLTAGPNYAGFESLKSPLISPLYADLRGLPPLKIDVGEREILLDDSRRLADKAQAANVSVDLTVWPVVPHVWQLANSFVPEAQKSMKGAAAFFRSKLSVN